jgi:hypothetical protein
MLSYLPEIANEDNEVVVDHIHLANAQFFLPGVPMVQTEGAGIMWRGRISQVAGFFFGTLRVCPIKTERFIEAREASETADAS